MLSLWKIKSVRSYVHCGFFSMPTHCYIPDHKVQPTGRWKIVVTEGKEPKLHLECRKPIYGYQDGWRNYWLSEDQLDIIETPEPPRVTEYINECARCEQ